MIEDGHLWAIGDDEIEGAEHLRTQIAKLAERHCLILRDTAVAVRYCDGSLTLNGEPFVAPVNLRSHSFASFLAGLALGAPPLTGAAVGAWEGCAGRCTTGVGIDDEFIREVEALMKPGTSALFVLDDEGGMEEILHSIHGLGGKVLKTNVDVERAKLIQFTLAAASAERGDK
jgi:uncharacterized membrane protein